MTPADVLVTPSSDDSCWIRCWAAANAWFRCALSVVLVPLHSRSLTDLANNSSVAVMKYCRGSTLINKLLRHGKTHSKPPKHTPRKTQQTTQKQSEILRNTKITLRGPSPTFPSTPPLLPVEAPQAPLLEASNFRSSAFLKPSPAPLSLALLSSPEPSRPAALHFSSPHKKKIF